MRTIQACFLIKEFLMQFVKHDRHFIGTNCIDNGFVFITQSNKDMICEIFFIYGFSEKREFICTSPNKFHIFRDGFGALGACFNFILDLLDATTGGFGICVGEEIPCFFG